MKQIKFRALVDYMDLGGRCWEYYTTFEQPTWMDGSWNVIVLDLQFTGLLDRNGKEIYEGDVLSGWRKGSNSDRGYTGVIEWQFEQAGWIIRCGKYIMEILSLAQSGWAAEPYNIHQLDSFEVIGNVFENKELLQTPHP